MIAEVDGLLEQFEFGKACDALYHFAWDEFCDWYLELAKVPLAASRARADAGQPSRSPGRRRPRQSVLGFVLDQMLRLLHPVMPFVTDELWTRADRRGLGHDGRLADVRGRRPRGRGRDRRR